MSGTKKIKFKYKIGEECYIRSRYEGVQKVTIVAQVEYEGNPCYELNKLVKVHKDGHSVGAAYYSEYEDRYTDYWEAPCGEHLLMQLGDNMHDSMTILFGTNPTDEILTQEIIDNINDKTNSNRTE